MTLQAYKFVITPVVQQTEDGKVVGEVTADAVVIYGLDSLIAWAEKFPTLLEEAESA